MCGHIQGGAFADLRLSGRRENKIDFKVFRSMERLRKQMKRAARFLWLQPKHGCKWKTHSSNPVKTPYGLYRHANDRLLHGDDQPQDGYGPRARQASIRTTTQWLLYETIARFFASIA